MSEYLDITGKKYGMLTATKRHSNNKWSEFWECECDCGKKVIRAKSTLQKGLSTSCGCDRYRKTSISNTRPNRFEVKSGFVVGFTHKGDEFIFDVDDFDIVSKYTWHKTSNGYICNKNKSKYTVLHRLIMNPPDGIDIDHINHDKCDNRKENLRFATRSQNLVNRRYKNKTGYRGVVSLPSGRFVAQIGDDYLGSYDTAEEASQAYEDEALKRYGEFVYRPNKSPNQYAERIS